MTPEEGLIESLKQAVSQIDAFKDVAVLFSLVLGLAFVVGGIFYYFSIVREEGTGPARNSGAFKGVLASVIVGTLLTTLPWLVETLSNSLSLDGNLARTAVLGETTIDGSSLGSAARDFSIATFTLAGIFGVIKGMIMLRDWGLYGYNEKTNPSNAVKYIIGGVLAINSPQMMEILLASVEGSQLIETFIN